MKPVSLGLSLSVGKIERLLIGNKQEVFSPFLKGAKTSCLPQPPGQIAKPAQDRLVTQKHSPLSPLCVYVLVSTPGSSPQGLWCLHAHHPR